MCGLCLFVSLTRQNEEKGSLHFEELENCLKKRGPDHLQKILCTHKECIDLFFCSSVLHLRGPSLVKQPVTDQNGNSILWNGEIFRGPLVKSVFESDTQTLAEKVFNLSSISDILKVFSSIEGPYAFIFSQANGLIWFGRDIFGRRSLLWKFDHSSFHLSSVAFGQNEWKEIPTLGIFCLDLNQSMIEKKFIIHLYPWSSSASGGNLKLEAELSDIMKMAEVRTVEDFNVQTPITEILNRDVPSDSVCSNFLHKMADLQNSKVTEQELFLKLLTAPILRDTVDNFEAVFSDAVKRRVEFQLGLCKKCYSRRNSGVANVTCDHASVGVLFSGGLDSIVIACLVDRHLPKDVPIDLINVAFGTTTDVHKVKKQKQCKPFDTPDRITGRNGLKELKNINSSRRWNFVEVNVSKEELVSKRKEFISNLLSPSCTVLDDSIGCALWFAAQGKGQVLFSDEYHTYSSPARILLVGMGADEQLAGYSRHRAKFNTSGWNGLIEELSLELDRIGSRNLGRDDRIIADSGVESRYPFLDENVVSFLNSLPVWLKANLNFPRGVGEKLLLRVLAFKLGLREAATLPKRAIQFGSRIAKIENTKEKGSDICDRLTVLKC